MANPAMLEPQATVEKSWPNATSLAKIRREHIRWLLLLHLDTARPEKTTDLALLAGIQAIYSSASRRELRRELDYLALKSLLTIREKSGIWQLKLTFQGIDVVEFTSDCPAGIRRPAAETDF